MPFSPHPTPLCPPWPPDWATVSVCGRASVCVWRAWCEWCVVAWRGVAWPLLGRVLTHEAAGPKHLACVEYAAGQPMWKRRAMARYPAEDHEHMVALCRAAQAEVEKDPGRSLFLLYVTPSLALSTSLPPSHSVIHTWHTYAMLCSGRHLY